MPKRDDFLKRTDRGMYAKPAVLFEGPNARTNFDPEKLAVLKAQIRQDGVLQPLVVRRRQNDQGGELQIFDGGRRIRCVQELRAAGHEIEWVPVVIRRASEAELMLEAATTDVGKEKLDFVDQTNLVKMLTGYGLCVKTIAKRIGKSGTWVRQRLALVGLEPPAQAALRAGEIKLGKALKLVTKDFDQQVAEIAKIRERRANGTKKAGSVISRPGKKACREMADELLQQQQLYTSQQVTLVFGWVNGDITVTELRDQLGAGALGVSCAADKPAVAVVH